jgi:hypothetical protein
MSNSEKDWLGSDQRQVFPIWLRVSYSLFVGALAIVYWIYRGPANFLWGCDIALLLTLVALWKQDALTASMALLVTLLPDIVWNIDFILHLVAGRDVLGANATTYMFETSMPLFVRALSLFHVFLAPLLVWMVYRMGYDPRALVAMTLLTWIVLPVSFVISDAEQNINWVLGVGPLPPPWMSAEIFLILFMLAVPVIILFPTHWLMKKWFYHPVGGAFRG